MLVNPTIAKLEALGLSAMAAGLADSSRLRGRGRAVLRGPPGAARRRRGRRPRPRRLARRLKAAKLRYPAAVEDIDFRTPRGLDRAAIASLAGAGWVARDTTYSSPGPPDAARASWPAPWPTPPLRRPHRPLPAHSTSGRGPGPRPGRRLLCPPARPDGPSIPAGPSQASLTRGEGQALPPPPPRAARDQRFPDRRALILAPQRVESPGRTAEYLLNTHYRAFQNLSQSHEFQPLSRARRLPDQPRPSRSLAGTCSKSSKTEPPAA